MQFINFNLIHGNGRHMMHIIIIMMIILLKKVTKMASEQYVKLQLVHLIIQK